MEDLENYFKLSLTYKDFYIENNPDIQNENVTMESFYFAVSTDVDIVFSALNILPSRSGYQFWKEAIFLYLFEFQDGLKNKTNLSKDIYPLIAKKYGTTATCVDRAMRRCFENVLYYVSKKESNYICAYLKNSILYPHSSEIIVKIVEMISSKNFQQNKIKLAI